MHPSLVAFKAVVGKDMFTKSMSIGARSLLGESIAYLMASGGGTTVQGEYKKRADFFLAKYDPVIYEDLAFSYNVYHFKKAFQQRLTAKQKDAQKVAERALFMDGSLLVNATRTTWHMRISGTVERLDFYRFFSEYTSMDFQEEKYRALTLKAEEVGVTRAKQVLATIQDKGKRTPAFAFAILSSATVSLQAQAVQVDNIDKHSTHVIKGLLNLRNEALTMPPPLPEDEELDDWKKRLDTELAMREAFKEFKEHDGQD